MLALTLDVDWAPEAVISDTLDLLRCYEASATIFATHHSLVLSGAASSHELGVHPNFNPGRTYEAVLDELLQIVPDAIGVRSHGLVQSSALSGMFRRKGLRYESNIAAHGAFDVPAFRQPSGLWQIPIHWGDYMTFANRLSWEVAPLIEAARKCLVVVNLHPVHVFINTVSAEHYATAKPHYQDPAVLFEHRQDAGSAGVRSFLVALLSAARATDITMTTLAGVVRDADARATASSDAPAAGAEVAK